MSPLATIVLLGQLWIGLVGICVFLRPKHNSLNPNVWLTIIALAILPILLSGLLVSLTAATGNFDGSAVAIIARDNLVPILRSPAAETASVPIMTIYAVIAGLFLLRTITAWARLQFGSYEPSDYHDVLTTERDLPPLALSWPRKHIIVPKSAMPRLSLEQQRWIITHERSHILNRDPEITLALLLLRDMFWINPAVHYLVTEWRMAAEMRADRAVTNGICEKSRHAYASLLLSAMQNQKGESALPCPSAYLTSNRQRSVKMRLTEIMSPKPQKRKPVIKTFLVLAALSLAIGTTETLTAFASPQTDQDAQPLTRVPPKMPSSCPGLDTSQILLETQVKTIGGKTFDARMAEIGNVIVIFDVGWDGLPQNIKIETSNHACFEGPTIQSLQQWRYELGAAKFGVKTRMTFVMAEDMRKPGSLERNLEKFANP